MKKTRKTIAGIAAGAMAFLMLCVFAAMPVCADYVDEHAAGVPAIGAMFADGDCPLTMEYSSLTFEVGKVPQEYRDGQVGNFVSDSSASTVTAESIIKNPTDKQVTATLLIPCGELPDYARYLDFETYTENLLANLSNAKVDGQEVKLYDRYSYRPDGDPVNSAKLLHDDLDGSGWLKPDMQVTVYRYILNDLEGDARFCYATAGFTYDPARTAVQIGRGADWTVTDDGSEARIRIEDGRYFEIYEYGEPFGTIEWTLYKDLQCQEEVSGKLRLVEHKTSTLYDLAMQAYGQGPDTEKHDWYNAVLARLQPQHDPDRGILTEPPHWNVSYLLQRWKAYEITLAPGQSVTNTVTVPLYPHHYMNYEPDLFVYEFRLLSGGTKMPSVYVNTEFYLVEKSGNTYAVGDFDKTERGYVLQDGKQPGGSLRFTLCTEAQMKEEKSPWSSLVDALLVMSVIAFIGQILLILAGIAVVLLICFGVTALIVWIVRGLIRYFRERS